MTSYVDLMKAQGQVRETTSCTEVKNGHSIQNGWNSSLQDTVCLPTWDTGYTNFCAFSSNGAGTASWRALFSHIETQICRTCIYLFTMTLQLRL